MPVRSIEGPARGNLARLRRHVASSTRAAPRDGGRPRRRQKIFEPGLPVYRQSPHAVAVRESLSLYTGRWILGIPVYRQADDRLSLSRDSRNPWSIAALLACPCSLLVPVYRSYSVPAYRDNQAGGGGLRLSRENWSLLPAYRHTGIPTPCQPSLSLLPHLARGGSTRLNHNTLGHLVAGGHETKVVDGQTSVESPREGQGLG